MRSLPALLAALLLITGCAKETSGAAVGRTHHKAAAMPAVAENAKAGDKNWDLRHRGGEHAIEGYTDHVSVLPGQPFRLFVSTEAPGYVVRAFRMGWYGGDEARQVWLSGHLTGQQQPGPKIDETTNTVTAPWQPSLTVDTSGWPEGDYLLRLEADSGAQRFVPMVVRSASTAGKVVVLNATTTWQAYNLWGGYDLYEGPGGFANRSRAVSFDRPYDGDGAIKFQAYEQPAVALMEKLGLPLAYETDNDLHAQPGLLQGAKALAVLGHDEYWSTAMRKAADQARDSGVNIAFLGANEVNRHIRFDATPLGQDRLVICYKSDSDPIRATDPAEVTVDWREGVKPWPESEITGVLYECNPVSAPYVVYDDTSWLLAGTGVRRGQAFPGMVGPEYDRINPSVKFPRPIDVLSDSPLICGNFSSHANSSYYTVKSGAGVFTAGTMRWVCAMNGSDCGHGVNDAAKDFVDKVTENLLTAMAKGPVGLSHPAQDNVEEIHPGVGAPPNTGADLD